MDVTLAQAEKLVEQHDNLFWNGWDLNVVNPKINGYTKVSGIFHNGHWCVRKVIKANDRGLYTVPPRYKIAA
jgi:hypothetical protein